MTTGVRKSDGIKCRFCGSMLEHSFVDLGVSPLCQTHIEPSQLNCMESFYPLHAYVCSLCFLVQLDEYVKPTEIFSDYAYFSSYSDSWVEHARSYTESMRERLQLGGASLVVEIASNDGYLLQHFKDAGIRAVGVEPAENVAAVAREKGIVTETKFFGVETARELLCKYGQPDLLLGNNVLAHVPDLNDFVAGMSLLLKRGGTITMEFPHLLRLMKENQFDTIYHEHFSYLSLTTVETVFKHHGLKIYDVEELSTHGGSLRIFATHTDIDTQAISKAVSTVREKEGEYGLQQVETYEQFSSNVEKTKRDLLSFLIQAREEGKSIVGYGAPGKGNTLLNYCGIRTDFLQYTVDRNPHKQGRYTPGTRIPILEPERIRATRPDYLLVLPWNLLGEIRKQTAYIGEWGGKWVVPIPEVKIFT